jgi:hypothetical protein
VAATFGSPESEYVAYLADPREVDEPGYGEPITGSMTLHLPPGNFGVATFSPTSGAWSPWIALQNGTTRLTLPSFHHDVVLVARQLEER